MALPRRLREVIEVSSPSAEWSGASKMPTIPTAAGTGTRAFEKVSEVELRVARTHHSDGHGLCGSQCGMGSGNGLKQSGVREQRKGQTLPTSTAKYDFVCCVITAMSARQC